MRRTFIVVLAVAALSTGPRAQSRRFITEQDLFKFTWVADPQISPDGATVVYVNVPVNDKKDGYDTALFVVAASGSTPPRRLTAGAHDTAPRWSPDGKRLVFVRATEKDGKTQPPQLYLLDMNGGEARPLTTLTRGAGPAVWSPDGTAVAFASATGPEEKKDDGAHHSDVKVVTRAVYRANGNPTYVDVDHRSHIFTIPATTSSPAAPARPRQVTDGEFDERNPVWAPDGSKIYFLSTRVAEPYFTEAGAEIFSVPAAGGDIVKVVSIAGSIDDMSVSPDGSRIAFTGDLRGTPIRSYSQTDLWITDAAPGRTPKNLTAAYDFDISGGIGGDQAAPRGQNRKPIVWSNDSLLVVSAERGSANLKRVSIATGAVESITDGPHDVMAYSATRDASKLAMTISTPTNIGDLAVIDSGQQLKPGGIPFITHLNHELFTGIQQSEPEEMWYRTFDGKQIQSWILKPPDFDAAKKNAAYTTP